MASSSTTTGQPKYGLRNDSDGLRTILATSAFDKLIPSASTFVASSSGTKQIPYDVFINHHGKDTKHTVASRIYNSLDATGLRVFLDKDELKLGDLLPKALEAAMATASIHIAVFSEHYAESPWCLAELEFMVKTRKTIIPLFYHVDPSDLRWVLGTYAKAFLEHEQKNRYNTAVLQGWKQALYEVSFCIGEVIKNNDDELRAVKNVANRVMKEMKNVPLEVAKYPVGLDETVQDFNTFALESSGSRHIVAIWGMGGAGKTTLAKEIFNRRSSAMDCFSFLSDVRDADRKGLLLEKQKTLIKCLGIKKDSLDNLDEGKQILKTRLSRAVTVLIVLDDVDHIDQLDALLPPKESLGDGSLIIVTSRNADVLQKWGISAIYRMRPLNATHAKQLFCWHAFLQNSPPLEFEDLVNKFLNACKGLPLSLKVLGGQLYGQFDKDYWQRTFNKFSQIPHEDITKKLKVSYDALNKHDKEMFLDTACLFIGYRKSAAIAAWDAEWDGLLGWETLFNKCLVEEDQNGLIRMHDHLRDLGREVANGHSPHRLWSPHQVIEIPPQQQTIQVRGMANAIGDNCYQQEGKIIIRTTQGERSLTPCSLGLKIFVGNGGFINQEHSEISRDLVWLQCNEFKHRSLPSWLSLKKLRILQFDNSRRLEDLWERDADAPLQLTELVIQRCFSLRGIPKSIGRLKNLKKISIGVDYGSCDTLSSLPQEFCHLQSLKHLEIKGFGNLSSLPSNFGELTSLQHLKLSGCDKLKMLPDSLKKLTLLEYLNLNECSHLIINSELHILENMTKLRYLNLNRCWKLEELRLPEVASLTKLYLTDTSLKELPANIFQQTKLTKLEIGSDFLTALPTSLGNLSSLTTFQIKWCRKLKSLPDSVEHLNLLRDLTINGSGVKCLPKSLIHLQSLTIGSTPISELGFRSGCMLKRIDLYDTKVPKISICGDCCPFLETLNLKQNKDLKELETLPATLKTIYVEGCNVLKDIRAICGLKSLQNLQIYNCEELDGLPCFAELASLEIFKLKGSRKVKKIEGLLELRSLRKLSIDSDELPSFAEFTCLKEFELQRCNELEKIQSLVHLKSLEKLNISDCTELDGLPCFAEFTSLKEFQLRRCYKLEKIQSLEDLKSLEKLHISDCPKLNGLPCFAESTSLKEFNLQSCYKLEKIQSLEHLKSLKTLKISNCPELEGLPGLAGLTSLKNFDLQWCPKLKKMEGLESITSLEQLSIYDCSELEGLPSLAELTSLKELKLRMCHKLEVLPSLKETISLKSFELLECHKLKKIEGLGNISLEKLRLYDCPELDRLPSLAELTSLEEFELQKCHKLKKIEGLENLRLLEKINISDCPELEVLPSLENIRSLEKLRIKDCSELERLPNLAELTSLKKFELRMCHKLKKIEGLENIRSLEELRINDCSELEGFPSLAELTSLTKLQMSHKLEKIEGLENLRLLKELKISDCPELKAVPSLQETLYLKNFQLKKYHKLEKIEGLENIISLEKLRIYGCPELDRLPSLAKLTSLKEFDLGMCHKLKKIEGLENIRSLEAFTISDCPELEVLLNLPKITSLKRFELEKCHKLEKIKGLENIRSVEELSVYDCSELDGLPGLAELTSLKEFDLRMCPKLKQIEGLESIKSLEKLRVHDCSELNGLPCLAELTSLKEFDLRMCPKLKKMEFLENIRSLKVLEISDCPELEALPSLPELTSLQKLGLKNCHKLEKIEGLEQLRLLKELELHNRSNAPFIVSLKHFERLESLVVVTNHISAVEPFVSSIQKWPEKVMICTRASCDVDSLKNFFEGLPSVSVFDYSHVVEFDFEGSKHLELRRPLSSKNANFILICLTIDCVYPDLRFYTGLNSPINPIFNSELGEGKWVWMGVFTQLSTWSLWSNEDYIYACNEKGEDAKVKVEAAWLVTGEQGSVVEAFSKFVGGPSTSKPHYSCP